MAAFTGGIVFLTAPFAAFAASREIAQAATQTPVAKQVGVVKSIN